MTERWFKNLDLFVLLIVGVAYLYMGVQSHFPGPLSDAVSYLFMAERYKPDTLVPPAVIQSVTYSHNFPPLFPMWLALFDGGADNLAAARLATSLSWIAALASFVLCARALELPALTRAAALGVFACSALVMAASLDVLSEGLFTALMLLSLTFMVKPQRSASGLYVAAGAAGLALFARSAGLLLMAPLALASLRSSWHVRIIVGLISLGPWLAWRMVHGQLRSGPSATYEGYVVEGMQGGLLEVVTANGHAMLTALGRFLLPLAQGASPWFTWSLSLGIFAVAFAAVREPAGRVLVAASAAGLAMLLLWPFPEYMQRFLLPLFPVLLLCGVFAVRRWRPLPVLLSLITLTNVVLVAHRVSADTNPAVSPFRFTSFWISEPLAHSRNAAEVWLRFETTAEASRDLVPPEACISTLADDMLFLYSRRNTRRIMPPADLRDSPEALVDWLQTQCDYVLAMNVRTELSDQLLYPVTLAPHRFEPLLVASRPDGATDVVLARFRAKE